MVGSKKVLFNNLHFRAKFKCSIKVENIHLIVFIDDLIYAAVHISGISLLRISLLLLLIFRRGNVHVCYSRTLESETGQPQVICII